MQHALKQLMRMVVVPIAAAAAILGAAAPAAAQKVMDFSADQVVLSAKGKVEQQNRLLVTADKVLLEKPTPDAKGKQLVLYRRDLKQTLVMNPEKKAFFESPLDEKELAADLSLPPPFKSEKPAGEEAVSGFACVKKDVEVEIEVKKTRKTVAQTLWVSDKFDIPLRVRNHEGRVVELRNIKEGKPDVALFEIPKDYKKAAKLQEVLPQKHDPFLDDDD